MFCIPPTLTPTVSSEAVGTSPGPGPGLVLLIPSFATSGPVGGVTSHAMSDETTLEIYVYGP